MPELSQDLERHLIRPLDPISLRQFVSVCEEGSLARAAEREAVVASALSKRLAALEADLGVSLLLRQPRGVQPTAAGLALLQRAREVLGAMQALRSEMGEFRLGVQGSVRVLASPSALAMRLPEDVAAFLQAHPRIHVGLDERMSPDIVRGVREGSADLGVLWDRIDLSGLEPRAYRSDRLCVALAPDHALARRPSLRLSDVLGLPSVNVSPGGQMDRMLRRQAALLGLEPNHRMQVSSIAAAVRLVGLGMGLAILPLESVAPHAGAGHLALVPLAEPWAVRRFVIVWRSGAALAAPARLLAETLHAAAA